MEENNWGIGLISRDEIIRYKKELSKISDIVNEKKDFEFNNEPSSELSNIYSTGSALGKIIYKAYSDVELLQILRDRANELGYPPSQKEMFWI